MVEFLEYFEAKRVSSVYFCFPWYIPSETADRMDHYYTQHFPWLQPLDPSQPASWHSYSYHLNPNIMDTLISQIDKINEKKWNIRVRFQPDLKMDEISNFIHGKEFPGQNRSQCLATSTRMNVLPSGEVSVCKMFPEFRVGNLTNETVFDLWHNENFKKCREQISCGLMPVCSKCILLYLHGG